MSHAHTHSVGHCAPTFASKCFPSTLEAQHDSYTYIRSLRIMTYVYFCLDQKRTKKGEMYTHSHTHTHAHHLRTHAWHRRANEYHHAFPIQPARVAVCFHTYTQQQYTQTIRRAPSSPSCNKKWGSFKKKGRVFFGPILTSSASTFTHFFFSQSPTHISSHKHTHTQTLARTNLSKFSFLFFPYPGLAGSHTGQLVASFACSGKPLYMCIIVCVLTMSLLHQSTKWPTHTNRGTHINLQGTVFLVFPWPGTEKEKGSKAGFGVLLPSREMCWSCNGCMCTHKTKQFFYIHT